VSSRSPLPFTLNQSLICTRIYLLIANLNLFVAVYPNTEKPSQYCDPAASFVFELFRRKTCLVSDVACDVKAGEEEKALVPNKDVESRKEMLLVESYLVSSFDTVRPVLLFR
jgi:hypothetical protein